MGTGTVCVISAASGTGKTSLVNMLVESLDDIIISISHTTREKRSSERDGENYFFIDKKQFQEMVANDEFLEHAQVFDNCYGTSKKWVEGQLEKGIDVILEIDCQGAEQVKSLYPGCVSIFILPPSLQELRNRLEKRKQDDPEVIEKRLRVATSEIPCCKQFDYIVVNDLFDVALVGLRSIVMANRLKRESQVARQQKLLANLAENQ